MSFGCRRGKVKKRRIGPCFIDIFWGLTKNCNRSTMFFSYLDFVFQRQLVRMARLPIPPTTYFSHGLGEGVLMRRWSSHAAAKSAYKSTANISFASISGISGATAASTAW